MRLTYSQKRTIWQRKMAAKEGSDKELMKEFGVCRKTIYNVVWEIEQMEREAADLGAAENDGKLPAMYKSASG